MHTRGNKEGVNAQFSLEEEQLAFPIRVEKGEEDGLEMYIGATQHHQVTKINTIHTNM